MKWTIAMTEEELKWKTIVEQARETHHLKKEVNGFPILIPH